MTPLSPHATDLAKAAATFDYHVEMCWLADERRRWRNARSRYKAPEPPATNFPQNMIYDDSGPWEPAVSSRMEWALIGAAGLGLVLLVKVMLLTAEAAIQPAGGGFN